MTALLDRASNTLITDAYIPLFFTVCKAIFLKKLYDKYKYIFMSINERTPYHCLSTQTLYARMATNNAPQLHVESGYLFSDVVYCLSYHIYKHHYLLLLKVFEKKRGAGECDFRRESKNNDFTKYIYGTSQKRTRNPPSLFYEP